MQHGSALLKQDRGRDFKDQEIHSWTFLFSIRLCKTSTGSCGIETLSFLPTESRTALNDLGHFIDAKLARLKQGSAIETERFRQAQYLKWCKQIFIPDPCWKEPGYEWVVACFVENLIINCNPRNQNSFRIRSEYQQTLWVSRIRHPGRSLRQREYNFKVNTCARTQGNNCQTQKSYHERDECWDCKPRMQFWSLFCGFRYFWLACSWKNTRFSGCGIRANYSESNRWVQIHIWKQGY